MQCASTQSWSMPRSIYRTMDRESTKEQLKSVLIGIKNTFKPENLFKSQMEDTHYELSPCVYFFTLSLPCHYPVLRKLNSYLICLNILIFLTEVIYQFTCHVDVLVLIQREVMRFYFLFGSLSAFYILNLQEGLKESEKEMKKTQWSLKLVSTDVKYAIGKRGLMQSLASEFCVLMGCTYICFTLRELKSTCFMAYVRNLRIKPLEYLVYFGECINYVNCIYLISIIPFLCVYFATEAEVQIFLLSEYVRNITHRKQLMIKKNGLKLELQVRYRLRMLMTRHLELRQLYVNNKGMIRHTAVQYMIPATLSFILNLYAHAEKIMNPVSTIMYFAIFIIIAMYTMLSGQRFEDEWRRYYNELWNLPWYTWSVENQKAYLLILTGASNITTVKIFNTTAVNYTLLLQIWKFVYSTANAVYNIYRK